MGILVSLYSTYRRFMMKSGNFGLKRAFFDIKLPKGNLFTHLSICMSPVIWWIIGIYKYFLN